MSKKNYISIDTEKIESLASGLGNVSNDFLNDRDNDIKNFSNIEKSGLMPNATSKVFSQMKTMSNIFETGKTMLLKNVEKMVDVELLLNNNAEKIIVPKLSLVNSSSFNEEVSSVTLSKNDGKSVDSYANTNSQDLEFKNVVKYNQKLNNVVKNYELKNGALEFNYNKKDDLSNIKNNVFLDEKQINTNTVIKNTNLSNIDNNVSVYDSKISINDLEV